MASKEEYAALSYAVYTSKDIDGWTKSDKFVDLKTVAYSGFKAEVLICGKFLKY